MRKLIALAAAAALLGALAVAASAHSKDPVTHKVKVRDDYFQAPSGLKTKIKIHRGDSIKFMWPKAGSLNEHTATEENGKWTSDEMFTGSFKKKFKKAGTWYVICALHPEDMRMKVTVKD